MPKREWKKYSDMKEFPYNEYAQMLRDRTAHDLAPATRVVDAATGKAIVDLAQSDLTRFTQLGFRPAEMFTYTAADGRTTLRGIILTPEDLPVVDAYVELPNLGRVERPHPVSLQRGQAELAVVRCLGVAAHARLDAARRWHPFAVRRDGPQPNQFVGFNCDIYDNIWWHGALHVLVADQRNQAN